MKQLFNSDMIVNLENHRHSFEGISEYGTYTKQGGFTVESRN